MKNFASRMTRRERGLVAALVIVALAAASYRYVWQPLETRRSAALSEIAVLERLTAAVRLAGPALKIETADTNEASATLITRTAAEYDLVIRRIEPEGAATRVVLDEASFDDLIQWLAVLETEHALTVSAIEMDRRPEQGIVHARLTLED